MADKIVFSVIIPTHNRRKELQQLLLSLENQDYPIENFEIIVADDESKDDTSQFMHERTNSFQGNIKYIYLTKQKNAALVRNIAAKNANGKIIAFIDSDCRAHPKWLINLSKMLEQKEVGCAGGPETFHTDDSFFVKCCSFSVTSPLTTGGIRGKKGKRLGKYSPRSFNMAVPVKVFKELNGFDGSFNYSEDIEFSSRIRESGYRLIYIPDAVVYHKRPDTIKKNFRQLFRMAKYRVVMEPVYFFPSFMLLSGVILFIGSFFSGTLFFLAKWFYTLLAIYLVLIGIAGVVKLKDLRAFFMVPFIFVIHQTAYATGFIRGLLTNH